MQETFHRFLSLVEFKKEYQLRSSGLNFIQLHVLERIKELGESKTLDIARAMNISPSTLIGILDGLEKLHFIKRQRQKSDKRVVMVSTTEEGNSKVLQHEAEDERFLKNLVSYLDEQERASFFSMLDKLTAKVKKPEELFL